MQARSSPSSRSFPAKKELKKEEKRRGNNHLFLPLELLNMIEQSYSSFSASPDHSEPQVGLGPGHLSRWEESGERLR